MDNIGLMTGVGIAWGVIMGTAIGEVVVDSWLNYNTSSILHDICNNTYSGIGNKIIRIDEVIQCAVQHNNMQVLADLVSQYNIDVDVVGSNSVFQSLHFPYPTPSFDIQP